MNMMNFMKVMPFMELMTLMSFIKFVGCCQLLLVHISFHFAGGDFLALSVWGACLSESANYGPLLRLENTELPNSWEPCFGGSVCPFWRWLVFPFVEGG
jgi:hypothetical protein